MQEACPFEFNFDPATFKVGDTVSYRVPSLEGFPFVARITAVHADRIEIVDPGEPGKTQWPPFRLNVMSVRGSGRR